MIGRIVFAQNVNRALGTNLAPWDLVEMPAEWMEALHGYTAHMPGYRKAQQEVENKFAQWRARHPTYRK